MYDLGGALVDQQRDVLGSHFKRIVLFECLRCAFDAVCLLEMGDGLDIVDHESTAGQSDGKRFGEGAVSHVDVIPRLSSRSMQAMSAIVEHARNTWYVVAAKSGFGSGLLRSVALVFVNGSEGLRGIQQDGTWKLI